MTLHELLKQLIDTLEAAEIPYMIVGSFASSIQGDPRSTHDIDVVVTLTPDAQAALLKAFPEPNYYLDDVALRDAVRRKDMINMLQQQSGDKVDFWILKDEPYDQESFRRRRKVDAFGMQLFVQQPEDTILSKLKWPSTSRTMSRRPPVTEKRRRL